MGWKGSQEVSCPTLLVKAESALGFEVVVQGFFMSGLESLRGWRLRSLSGQPVPQLGCPQGEVSLHLRSIHPLCHLLPMVPYPPTMHYCEELALAHC